MKFSIYSGIFFVFLNAFFSISLNATAKMITYLDPNQLNLARHAGTVVFALPLAVYSQANIIGPKGSRLPLLALGFIISSSTYLQMTAYWYLTVSEATVLMCCVPITTTLLSRIFLKEKIGLVQSVAMILTVLGVLLNQMPTVFKMLQRKEPHNIKGILSAISYNLLGPLTYLLTRRVRNVHSSVTTIYGSLFGVLLSLVLGYLVFTFHLPRCDLDQMWIPSVGVQGFLNLISFALALKAEHAGAISVLKYSFAIVLSILFQVIFFEDYLDLYNIGGCILVMVSISVLFLKKWISALPSESNLRQKLKWLLI